MTQLLKADDDQELVAIDEPLESAASGTDDGL
jgi:hypothetical protein